MRQILILPPNHTEDDSAIWRAAIARKISPLRCQRPEEYIKEVVPSDALYYYGNTLHHRRVIDAGLELRAQLIDPHWPSRVADPAVFGRSVTPMTYGEFSRIPTSDEFFVKCVHEKWFKPLVCSPARLPRGSSLETDILHVQSVAKFVDEVRCWVVDGQILTWSYYRRNEKPWRAGIAEVPAMPEWNGLVGSIAHALPRVIVIDLGLIDGDPKWRVIEANEPWASGIYDCDPAACLSAILEGQKPA